MINRLRVILPPDSVVIALVIVFAVAEGPFFYLEWKWQQALDIPRPGLLVLRVVAMIYGFWRVANFHPVFHTEYRDWLYRSPWTYRLPLPGGPIGLVWQDALPLGGLTVMAAFFGPMVPVKILCLFLFGNILALAVAASINGPRGYAYFCLFGIGLGIRLWPNSWEALATLVVTYLLGLVGLRLALIRFRDDYEPSHETKVNLQQVLENACGWPFDQLKPPPETPRRFTRLDGLMIGLLSGWFLYAFESLVGTVVEQRFLVQKAVLMIVPTLALARFIIYNSGFAPPISLFGRIATFRWIIPGYDKVFLGPICTILVAFLAFDRFRPPGMDDLILLPIALGTAVVVALDTGPSLNQWRLTGQHRMTVSSSKGNGEYVKVG